MEISSHISPALSLPHAHIHHLEMAVVGVLGSLLNYVEPGVVGDGLDVLRTAHHQPRLSNPEGWVPVVPSESMWPVSRLEK